ncbi:MAG: FtsQ-type POTRA domain-containing protein [Microbacteriaceae bacterium]
MKRPPSRLDQGKPKAAPKPAVKPLKSLKPISKPAAKQKAESRSAEKSARAIRARESKLLKLTAKSAKGQTRAIEGEVIRAKFGESGKLRKNVIISVIAAFSALVALVLAAVFSPMLAVERIAVRGQKLVSQGEIKKALKDVMGKPLPQINPDDIAKDLEKFALIESISVISAPPHTLVIRVTERTPIAILWVEGFGYSYFDPAGVKVGRATDMSRLPVLKVTGTPGKSATFNAAIDVLMALPASLLPKIQNMTAKSKDNVYFQLRGYAAQRVIWGDSSNAVLKSKVLAALIKNQGKNDRVTYDVSSPTAPVVRFR